jgi:protein-disulfide isomerase
MAAALAAQCAAAIDRFELLHDSFFRNQQRLGRTPWAALAHEAGIADTARFTRCMSDSSTVARVQADIDVGRRLEVRGTPTVIVNEWRLTGAATFAVIDSIIASLLGRPD